MTEPKFATTVRFLDRLEPLDVIAAGDGVARNPAVVLIDPVRVAWSLPDAAPSPAAPEPVTASFSLYAPDAATLAQLRVGEPCQVRVEAVDVGYVSANGIVTVDGYVTELTARPPRGRTGLVVEVQMADSRPLYAEHRIPAAAWPAETTAARLNRVRDSLAARLLGLDNAPLDLTHPVAAVEVDTTATDVIDQLLTQAIVDQPVDPATGLPILNTRPGTWFRYYQAGEHYRVLSNRMVSNQLPGRLTKTGQVWSVTVGPGGTGIHANRVDRAAAWRQSKPDTLDEVAITYVEAGAAATVTARTPGVATPAATYALETNLTARTDADRAARTYLADADRDRVWEADRFTLNPTLEILNQLQTWTWFPKPDSDLNTVDTALGRVVALYAQRPTDSPDGAPVYYGQLSGAELLITGGDLTITFALRASLPRPDGDAAGLTWTALRAQQPAMTWKNAAAERLDPALTWYDLRLARKA